jgi:TolB protein
MYWTWLGSDRLEVHSRAGSPDAFLGEIGLDGAAVGNPVATPGPFRAPAVSHDRRYRSYVGSGGDAAPPQLVVERLDGTGRHAFPVFGIAAFSFAPSGNALAFIAPDDASDEALPLPVGPLRIVDPASGSVRTVLDGTVVGFFWAPDGRTIASLRIGAGGGIQASAGGRVAATDAGFRLELVFIDPASGAVRSERQVQVSGLFATQLLPYFDQYALSHRLWSPDSESIVLPLVDGGSTSLYVIRADGSEPERLVDAAMGFWSP